MSQNNKKRLSNDEIWKAVEETSFVLTNEDGEMWVNIIDIPKIYELLKNKENQRN